MRILSDKWDEISEVKQAIEEPEENEESNGKEDWYNIDQISTAFTSVIILDSIRVKNHLKYLALILQNGGSESGSSATISIS